jgi:nitrite reductase/ring-hydroxylating ferredoxin subunit/predicted secreted protein
VDEDAGGFMPAMRTDELTVATDEDPGIRRARVGRGDILLVRLADGEVVAFATQCPHQNTDLELAKLWDGNVRCARHNYLYDPRTGENLQPTRDHLPENLWKLKPGYLPTYPVIERDGWILVGPVNPPPPTYDPALEVRPDRAGEVEVDDAHEDLEAEIIRVESGATFELRLPMSPLPGYEWALEVEGPVTVLGESALDDVEPELRVSLSAGDAGDASIRCGYSAPWDAEPSEFRLYQVHIVEPG